MGGAVARGHAESTAFAHRSAANLLWIINLWANPQADPGPHQRGVNDVYDATRPNSTGGG